MSSSDEVVVVVWVEQANVVMRVCLVVSQVDLSDKRGGTYSYEDCREEERVEEGDGLDGGAITGGRCGELSRQEVVRLDDRSVELDKISQSVSRSPALLRRLHAVREVGPLTVSTNHPAFALNLFASSTPLSAAVCNCSTISLTSQLLLP